MENNMQRFQMPRVIRERTVESKMNALHNVNGGKTMLMIVRCDKKKPLLFVVRFRRVHFRDVLSPTWQNCFYSHCPAILHSCICIAYANNRHTNQLQCQRFHEKASNTVELIINALESCGVLCALCVSDTQSWTSSNRHLADEFHSDHVSKLKLEMF